MGCKARTIGKSGDGCQTRCRLSEPRCAAAAASAARAGLVTPPRTRSLSPDSDMRQGRKRVAGEPDQVLWEEMDQWMAVRPRPCTLLSADRIPLSFSTTLVKLRWIPVRCGRTCGRTRGTRIPTPIDSKHPSRASIEYLWVWYHALIRPLLLI